MFAALSVVALATTVVSIPPPRTTGEVQINLASGRLAASVCVENWPTGVGRSVSLHGGLNLAHVRDQTGKVLNFSGWYGGAVDGEGRVYDFDPPAAGPVCFDYVGSAPMFPEYDAVGDFKGLIAADGKSLRASEQAVWLPTPFDPKAKKRFQNTTYRLHVVCDDCTLLYMNGAAPVQGHEATFESATPQRPLLFAGKGLIDVGPGVNVVNFKLSPEGRAGWTTFFHSVRGFYANYLGRGFDDTPTILRFDSLDRGLKPKRRWGFATWPTLAFGNGDLDAMGQTLSRDDEEGRGNSAYVAHETAHYYFNSLTANGPYRWLLVESAAEFMSWKALASMKGQGALEVRLTKTVADFNAFKTAPLPLNAIVESEQIGSGYRYVYGPLLLESLERSIGDTRMRQFMRGLLNARELSSWADVARIARAAGVSSAEWDEWTRRCVDGAPKACISALATPPSAPSQTTEKPPA